MPTPPLSKELAIEALNLVAEHGGVMQAAKASGISYTTLRARYVSAQARGIETTYIKPVKASSGSGKRILVIGDIHAPFQHPDTIAFLSAVKHKINPDRVVCLGDELDAHAISQHDPDPDGFSAGHELALGLEFMQELYQLFPVVSVCESNHGARPFKRAYRAGLPKAYLKDYRDFMGAPLGWNWDFKHVVDGIVFEHGEGVSGTMGAMKRAQANMRSTCIGHLHSDAGILWFSTGERTIFAFNAGCLIDTKAYAYAYGKNSLRKPVIGVGFIDRGNPHFIHMDMDDSGRWTGKV
jgi:hypothetical protein